MATDDNNSGVIAMLVIIAVLLIGGFLYFQRDTFQDPGEDLTIEMPDVQDEGVTRDEPPALPDEGQ